MLDDAKRCRIVADFIAKQDADGLYVGLNRFCKFVEFGWI
jgi:hypothetical protein